MSLTKPRSSQRPAGRIELDAGGWMENEYGKTEPAVALRAKAGAASGLSACRYAAALAGALCSNK